MGKREIRLPVIKNSRLKCGRTRPAFEQILQIAEVCLHRFLRLRAIKGSARAKMPPGCISNTMVTLVPSGVG